MDNNPKDHWERVYTTRQPHEVSWTQTVPKTSLDFIRSFGLAPSAPILDVGGGDSHLTEHLLREGYTDLTVLDISEAALAHARQRLGKDAEKVKWIVGDITTFQPPQAYALWHDRATFHFMNTAGQIDAYLGIARQAVTGFMTIGTFSQDGPEKCSGLPVRRYDEAALEAQLSTGFQKLRCITEDHTTPFNTTQNFLFCSFRKAGHPGYTTAS